MLLKTQLPLFLFLSILCSCLIVKANGYCSLEKMRKFAMEACEHLFLQDEPRQKRSLSYDSGAMNDIDGDVPKSYTKKHHNYSVRRSVYPQGGYLKVGRTHYIALSQIEVFPKYKAKHMKSKHLDGETRNRFKREHVDYNNIPYCCYNNCDEDFFC